MKKTLYTFGLIFSFSALAADKPSLEYGQFDFSETYADSCKRKGFNRNSPIDASELGGRGAASHFGVFTIQDLKSNLSYDAYRKERNKGSTLSKKLQRHRKSNESVFKDLKSTYNPKIGLFGKASFDRGVKKTMGYEAMCSAFYWMSEASKLERQFDYLVKQADSKHQKTYDARLAAQKKAAAEKAEKQRIAKEKAEAERIAKAKAEAKRQKEIRLAREKARAEEKARWDALTPEQQHAERMNAWSQQVKRKSQVVYEFGGWLTACKHSRVSSNTKSLVERSLEVYNQNMQLFVFSYNSENHTEDVKKYTRRAEQYTEYDLSICDTYMADSARRAHFALRELENLRVNIPKL